MANSHAKTAYKQVDGDARPNVRSKWRPASPSQFMDCRAQNATERLSAAKHQRHDAADGEFRKPTILLVEDNADMLFYLETEFLVDYRVICEHNGADGLQTAMREIPDVIVSDVIMPKMDGREMCRQLKSHGITKHIPIILLTAKSQDHDRIAGLTSGADVYFSKPFSTKVLKAQIASLIANRTDYSGNAQPAGSTEKSGRNELDRDFTHSAEKIILQHLADTSFSPEVLADRLGISPRQLYRKLSAISGTTVSEFILRVRMNKAAELLSDWQQNVSEIATSVGYTEASNFSRAFRKHFGCSPTKFRERL